MMKLPSDETPMANMNGDGYLSDEYDQLEMIPAPIRDGDFSEYMWMENEEEYNSQVLRELEEEELMEQCIVAMLDDEEAASSSSNNNAASTNNNAASTNNNAVSTNNNTTTSRRTAESTTNSSLHNLSESVNNMSLSSSSNGVQNSNNSNSVENGHSSRPKYTAQSRLQRIAAPVDVRPPARNESEQKSNLNPDAKEFVPLARNSTTTTSNTENKDVSS